MRRFLASLAVAGAVSTGSAASAATEVFSYAFDSFTSISGEFLGTLSGRIFTIDDVVATISSTGGTLGVTSFSFDTTLGGFHVSGDVDANPASYATDHSFFDIAVIAEPVTNLCTEGAGFCLLGSFASVTLPDGTYEIFTVNPGSFAPGPATVPLPASLPMLAAGIGVTAFVARRRKSA